MNCAPGLYCSIVSTSSGTPSGASTAAAVGRRERRKQANGERVLDCALRLFVEQGYHETSIDEIAARADVARGTVFNHFPRKRAFLERWGDRRREALRQALLDQPESLDTATRLANAAGAWADLYESDRELSRPLVRYWLTSGDQFLPPSGTTSALLADAIRRGQRQGDVRAGIDPDVAGLALFDVMLGVLFRWAAADAPALGSLRPQLLASLDVALVGLLTSR